MRYKSFPLSVFPLIAFLCIFSPSNSIAQDEGTINCEEEWTNEFHVLESECIPYYFEGLAPAISYVFDASENHRERARDNTKSSWRTLQWVQIIIVLFGALATLMIAFGDVIRIGDKAIGKWAVVPTTIVTILTSLEAFYDWRGERAQQYILAQDMATIRSQMNLDLLFVIGTGMVPDQIESVTVQISGAEPPDDKLTLEDYVQYMHDSVDRALRSFQADALQRMNDTQIGTNDG